ncbi:MAG: hypothetical protein H6704_06615 [Myxococcales bacterium]|nr:hypothetical protein [Myxococcales bacterium]
MPVAPPPTTHDEAPDDSIVDPPDPTLFTEGEGAGDRFAEHSIEEIDLVDVEELMTDGEARRFGTDVHDERGSKADAIDEKLDRLRGR